MFATVPGAGVVANDTQAFKVSPPMEKRRRTVARRYSPNTLRRSVSELLSAHIHPDHTASNAVAAKLDFDPTGKLDDEGEMIWK